MNTSNNIPQKTELETTKAELQAIKERDQAFLRDFDTFNKKLDTLFNELKQRIDKNEFKNKEFLKAFQEQLNEKLSLERTNLYKTYPEKYEIYEAITNTEVNFEDLTKRIQIYNAKPEKRAVNFYPKFLKSQRPRRSSFSFFESLSNPFRRTNKNKPRSQSFGGKHKNKTRKH
jgi:hypothetical protein